MRVRSSFWLAVVLAVAGCNGGPVTQNPSASQRPAAAVPSLSYGAFEWNADDAVSRWKNGTLWTFLRQKHVDDVLAGFDDRQIARYSRPKGAAEFNSMIAQAAGRGIRFELLLGDPSWILPSGAPTLEGILKRLRPVNFSGLNLDLEPNEVKGYPLRTVFEDLVTQMHTYIGVSRWPVTLDVGYFYAGTSGYCLICHLQQAGLKRIDLLTYISDPKTVAAIDRPILAHFPAVTFEIGQSVEPPSVLPPRDSYWADGFARFYTDMDALNSKFTSTANYGGIVVQSMQYIEEMKP